MGSLDKMPEEIPPDGDGRDTIALDGDGRVFEEIRLQASLHDVEWARDDRAAHATEARGCCVRHVYMLNKGLGAHPPATKWCHDFAGSQLLFVVRSRGGGAVTDILRGREGAGGGGRARTTRRARESARLRYQIP